MSKAKAKRLKSGVEPKPTVRVDVLNIPHPYSAVLVESTHGSYIVSPWDDAYATRVKDVETTDRVDGVDVYRKKSPLRWTPSFGRFMRNSYDSGMLPRFRVIRDLRVGGLLQTGRPGGYTIQRGYIKRLTLV